MHSPMAVRTQGGYVVDCVFAFSGKPYDMVDLEKGFPSLVFKRGWRLTKLTHSISPPLCVLGNIRISRKLLGYSWAASWFFE